MPVFMGSPAASVLWGRPYTARTVCCGLPRWIPEAVTHRSVNARSQASLMATMRSSCDSISRFGSGGAVGAGTTYVNVNTRVASLKYDNVSTTVALRSCAPAAGDMPSWIGPMPTPGRTGGAPAPQIIEARPTNDGWFPWACTLDARAEPGSAACVSQVPGKAKNAAMAVIAAAWRVPRTSVLRAEASDDREKLRPSNTRTRLRDAVVIGFAALTTLSIAPWRRPVRPRPPYLY